MGENKPEYKVTGILKDFTIDFEVIKLFFNSFEFTSLKGQKPTVKVDVEKIEFAGELSLSIKLKMLSRNQALVTAQILLLPQKASPPVILLVSQQLV